VGFCRGGEVGFGVGAAVPVFRGAVVTTGARVVAVVTPGPGTAGASGASKPAVVVVVVSPGADVEVGRALEVVVAGRVVVVVRTARRGDWLATCCLGDVSLPVATSRSRAARAMEASAYSPTLKR